MLTKVRWNRATVRDFLGCYLTEPKSHVYFSPPEEPLSAAKFAAACDKRGLRLDPRTQMLFSGNAFFINGEDAAVPRSERKVLQQLADCRELDNLGALTSAGLELLYCWYSDGFLAPR
jgi:50S ribosomal protein L16 3-hydroxylase